MPMTVPTTSSQKKNLPISRDSLIYRPRHSRCAIPALPLQYPKQYKISAYLSLVNEEVGYMIDRNIHIMHVESVNMTAYMSSLMSSTEYYLPYQTLGYREYITAVKFVPEFY